MTKGTNAPTTEPIPDNDTDVVARNEKGQWLERPKGGAKPFTSDTARTAVQRRWDKYRQAAAAAVAAEMGSIVPNVRTPRDAWGVLNGRLASQIMDSDKPRGADLAILGRNMGATPREDEVAQQQYTGTDTQAMAALGREALAHILAQLETRREIVDAELVDDD